MSGSWPGGHVWTRDPFAVLDLETTGLDPGKFAIVEFAAVRVEALREVDSLSLLINPGPAELEAFSKSRAKEVNRIDPRELARAPFFWDGPLERILEFLGDLPLMAYNAPFDASFLRAALEGLELEVPTSLAPGNALDPLVWVRDVDRYVRKRSPTDRRHSLASAAERRGLKPTGDLHRALADVRLTLALAKRLLREKRVPGWTARLLRRQEARREAQDEDRRAYRARVRGAQAPGARG